MRRRSAASRPSQVKRRLAAATNGASWQPANPALSSRREDPNMRSIDRFLTTHTGSLPRPDDLVRVMYSKEEGQAVDRAELASHVRKGVAGVVARQREAGVDIINDGEMSKPSYATYVK